MNIEENPAEVFPALLDPSTVVFSLWIHCGYVSSVFTSLNSVSGPEHVIL